MLGDVVLQDQTAVLPIPAVPPTPPTPAVPLTPGVPPTPALPSIPAIPPVPAVPPILPSASASTNESHVGHSVFTHSISHGIYQQLDDFIDEEGGRGDVEAKSASTL